MNESSPPAAATIFMMPSLYNEVIGLLSEAHHYFYRQGVVDQQHLTSRERTMFASEMSRITIRISCIMAWLMARKAVLAGKLSEEEAEDRFPLDCKELCLAQHIEAESLLPEPMTRLLDRSYEIYSRVERLDRAMLQKHSTSGGT